MANYDDIKSYYVNILQRDPSDDEVRSWEAPVNAGALNIDQVRQAFINSSEAQNVAGVIRVYQAAFDRVPDQEGLKNWVNSGLSMDQIAEGFVNSEEFINRYGSNNVTQAFVTSLYFQVLGRAPDAEGLANWTNSGLSAAQILAGFSESQEFKNTTATAVSTFLDDAGKGTQDYSGKLIEDAPVTEPVGQTFTLTEKADNISGTDANDTINGLIGSGGTADSVNIGDTIKGGAGNDTLNLIATGPTTSAIASIQEVETINVTDVVGATLNAALISGANINFIGTLAGQTSKVTGLSDLSALVGISGKGNLEVVYNAGSVTGSNDVANVQVRSVGSMASNGTITRSTVNVSNSNAIEGVDLDVDGNSYVALTGGSALKSITVTGAGSLDLTSTGGAVLTGDTTNSALSVDASAATGKQTYLLGAGAMTVKGGSADDTFAFGTTLGSTDKVDGGNGLDKVSMELLTAVQITPELANVEVLDAKFSAGGIINGSKAAGLETVNVEVTSAAVNFTNLAAGASTVNFNKDAGAVTSGAVAIGYATGAKADVTLNVGEIDTGSTGGVANKGDVIALGATTLSNVDKLLINSVRDTDNTASVVNTLASLNVGTATELTVKTSDLASISTGDLTGASLVKLEVAADGGDASVGAFVGAGLTDLVLTSVNKADLAMGAVGAANNAVTASKLTNLSVTTGAEATVVLGAIDAATKSVASGLAASALKTVNYDLGDKATVTIGAINAADESGANGNAGAGVAQLDSYTFKLGADATADVSVGAVSARSVTDLSYTVADHTTARAFGATLNIDESIGSLSIAAGKNVTETFTINGIDDGGTDLYDLSVGSITATGEGNVKIAGLSTGVKSIASIDLSAVKGTSEVAASTLSGTTGINITVGEGGTTVTGVSGSDKSDIITGGKGADILIGGAGADQITGGLGADTIKGGAGNDTIDLTEATESIDRVQFEEFGAANVDTVSGFKVGSDIIGYAHSLTTLSNGFGTDLNAAIAAGSVDVLSVAKNSLTADATTDLGAGDYIEFIKFTEVGATDFASAIGTGTVTVSDANLGATEGIAAAYYDSANGQAVFGFVVNSSATVANVLNSSDTFEEVGRVNMTLVGFNDYNASTHFEYI